MSNKDKYRISDRDKAYRNQAIEYDSSVFAARGCGGFFLGVVLDIIAVCIFPNISGKYILMLFLFELIGLPYYMYSTEAENIKKATDQAEFESQMAANERRLALKCSEFYSNAPTTLIAESIKYYDDLRKDAVKAKSYKELLEIEKSQNIEFMNWKNENVKISFWDDRLNVIELDAVVKQTNEMLPYKSEEQIEDKQQISEENENVDDKNDEDLHNEDIVKQLRDLKTMLDEDLITKEDFENKKKQLLDL